MQGRIQGEQPGILFFLWHSNNSEYAQLFVEWEKNTLEIQILLLPRNLLVSNITLFYFWVFSQPTAANEAKDKLVKERCRQSPLVMHSTICLPFLFLNTKSLSHCNTVCCFSDLGFCTQSLSNPQQINIGLLQYIYYYFAIHLYLHAISLSE